MSLRDAVFATPDGAELAFRIRPGRDPLVLLHGLGCDASMWDGVVAKLPDDVGLLVPDLRGHGRSTLGWRPPSIDLWADDVMRLVAAKGIERPAIAGLSMGGYTAFAIEAAHRGSARAFAFVSTTAAPDDEAGKQRRAAGIATICRDGWRAYADELMPSLLNVNRPEFATHREHLLTMFERAGDAGLPPALMAIAARHDRRAMLMTIGVPCIAIVGAVDAITPPDRARAIAAAIPGARLHVLDDVGHMSAIEAPHKVAGLLGTL